MDTRYKTNMFHILTTFSHLSQVADLFVSHFYKHLYDEVNCFWRVSVDLHEADAAGQEVHEKAKERRHIVDLRCFSDTAQSFQSGHNLLLDRLLLTDLSEVVLVYEVEEPLLERVKNLQDKDRLHCYKLYVPFPVCV